MALLSRHYLSNANPIFAQWRPNGKLRPLVDSQKNKLIADDYINNNQPVCIITDAAQQMSENCSVKLRVTKHLIAFKWPTNNQLNFLHSILQAEHSHTGNWRKNSVISYQPFEPHS